MSFGKPLYFEKPLEVTNGKAVSCPYVLKMTLVQFLWYVLGYCYYDNPGILTFSISLDTILIKFNFV